MPSIRPEGSGAVKSATRTLDILEFVVGCTHPVSAAQIAGALDIPVSSLSYLLGTLVERGYLVREGRLHAPGPALVRLQPHHGETALADRVGPLVRSISLQLNETAAFFVRHDFEMEAIASEVSVQALRYNVEVGQRLPLHAFAAGKALLAAFSDADLAAYFKTVERAAFTPQTITDKAALRREIESIRRDGLARTGGEYTPGIVGLGHAVIGPDGALLGAVSVAVPAARMTAALEERTGALLRRAAEALERA